MENSFEASHYTKSLCLYSANNSGNISHRRAKPQKTKVLEKHRSIILRIQKKLQPVVYTHVSTQSWISRRNSSCTLIFLSCVNERVSWHTGPLAVLVTDQRCRDKPHCRVPIKPKSSHFSVSLSLSQANYQSPTSMKFTMIKLRKISLYQTSFMPLK